jgi:hypothetical protein
MVVVARVEFSVTFNVPVAYTTVVIPFAPAGPATGIY